MTIRWVAISFAFQNLQRAKDRRYTPR